jgi:hypothetical protein
MAGGHAKPLGQPSPELARYPRPSCRTLNYRPEKQAVCQAAPM